MTRDELLELLPLYAGGDLDPTQRLEVEEALAADPSLREALEPYLQVDALLQAALTGAEALSAEAARELLPLHAGGDLSAEQGQRVAAAVAGDAGLRDELEAFSQLDGMLSAAFAEAEPAAAPQVRVRVQCPFCHDSLNTGALVFCAECTTPHHEACFAQNAGCSLLGCEATRSIASNAPTQRVCSGCERQTPAEAPFCAWCGQALEAVDPAPRSARLQPSLTKIEEPSGRLRVLPNVGDLWRFAAAAALLLVSGVSVGAVFGLQQRGFLEALAAQAVPPTPERAGQELTQMLLELARANERFAQEDLEGDGYRDYATDLGEVWRELRRRMPREELAREFPNLVQGLGSPWFEVVLDSSPTQPMQRWYAVAGFRRNAGLRSGDDRVYFINQDLVVQDVPRAQLQIDRDECTLTSGGQELLELVRQATREDPGVLAVSLGPESIQIELRAESELHRVHSRLPHPLLERLQREGWGLSFSSERGRRAFFGADLVPEGAR